MTTRWSVEQARPALPGLVERACLGQSSIITRDGKPIAAIVPLAHMKGYGRVNLVVLAGSGKGLWSGMDGSAAHGNEWGPPG